MPDADQRDVDQRDADQPDADQPDADQPPYDRSPYELVLGTQLELLHPRLSAYFGAIPRGSVGRGVGTFDVVGSPRHWLWPVLGILARVGIVFPVWQRNVGFTVVNTSAIDARGNVTVRAARTFEFPDGDRTMTDAITAEPAGLVDHLGTSRRLLARLDSRVVDGSLELVSTVLWLRIRRSRLRIPGIIAPVVRLRERFDDASGRQQVSVLIDSPQLGRLYEYSGSFTYEIARGNP